MLRPERLIGTQAQQGLRGGIQVADAQVLIQQKYAGHQASSSSVPSMCTMSILKFSGQTEHPVWRKSSARASGAAATAPKAAERRSSRCRVLLRFAGLLIRDGRGDRVGAAIQVRQRELQSRSVLVVEFLAVQMPGDGLARLQAGIQGQMRADGLVAEESLLGRRRSDRELGVAESRSRRSSVLSRSGRRFRSAAGRRRVPCRWRRW